MDRGKNSLVIFPHISDVERAHTSQFTGGKKDRERESILGGSRPPFNCCPTFRPRKKLTGGMSKIPLFPLSKQTMIFHGEVLVPSQFRVFVVTYMICK